MTHTLTLKFSLVSHGFDYDTVHIPSVTKLAGEGTEDIQRTDKLKSTLDHSPDHLTLTQASFRYVNMS